MTKIFNSLFCNFPYTSHEHKYDPNGNEIELLELIIDRSILQKNAGLSFLRSVIYSFALWESKYAKESKTHIRIYTVYIYI